MPDLKNQSKLDQVLDRILDLLPGVVRLDWQHQPAAIWRVGQWRSDLVASAAVDDITLDDLLHVDDQRQQLLDNTQQFIAGLPANNALLWGARGTGKSSLIHALLNAYADRGLRLVEIQKEDLASLAQLVERLASEPFKFVVFCDDLSFDVEDTSYKALKSALEGSIFKTASNVVIYATSNRRHLVPEHMSDNLNTRVVGNELHESEVVEEKISLSDRFGLWLSFYPFKQDAYLSVVEHWVSKLADKHEVTLDLQDEQLRKVALQWALARGVRNGRTAQYFARHWVGQSSLNPDELKTN